jgi:hypothetical protein
MRETEHRFGRAWLMLSLSRREWPMSLEREGKWLFEWLLVSHARWNDEICGGVLGEKLMNRK